jgi:hypothetical protein
MSGAGSQKTVQAPWISASSSRSRREGRAELDAVRQIGIAHHERRPLHARKEEQRGTSIDERTSAPHGFPSDPSCLDQGNLSSAHRKLYPSLDCPSSAGAISKSERSPPPGTSRHDCRILKDWEDCQMGGGLRLDLIAYLRREKPSSLSSFHQEVTFVTAIRH